MLRCESDVGIFGCLMWGLICIGGISDEGGKEKMKQLIRTWVF